MRFAFTVESRGEPANTGSSSRKTRSRDEVNNLFSRQTQCYRDENRSYRDENRSYRDENRSHRDEMTSYREPLTRRSAATSSRYEEGHERLFGRVFFFVS